MRGSGTYKDCSIDDLIQSGIIEECEREWVDKGCPWGGFEIDKRDRARKIYDDIVAALETGKINEIPRPESYKRGAPYIISDYIGNGINGIKSHVDGKMYDSKSEYYKAVKAAGCFISEAGTERAKRQETSENEIKQTIKETIEKLGG